MPASGKAHYAWKGDAARTETKRARAQRMYQLGPCDSCGKPATDRHHRDDDTGNNAPENIGILCRRCHMLEDGRLDAFKQVAAANAAKLRARAPRPCRVCNAPSRVLSKGRCHNCAVYWWRTGEERTADRRGPVRGSGNHNAKLSEADVVAIRSAAAGGESASETAARYGIRRGAVWAIVTRKTWRHVP